MSFFKKEKEFPKTILTVKPELEVHPMAANLSPIQQEYFMLWKTMQIRPEKQKEVDSLTQRLIRNRATYQEIERQTAVPWYIIAVIHNMESSCNFKTHLHNGDPLTAKTYHVPKGRPETGTPPFSFVVSAIDALKYDNFAGKTDWQIWKILERLERYNGWGYRRNHMHDGPNNGPIYTPYLWSYSTHYLFGKYVADGKFNVKAVSKNCGAAVLLKNLILIGEIKLIES